MARMIGTGFGNFVSVEKIIAVVEPDSAPIKRITLAAKESGKLVDVTHGRKTRSAIVTESDHIILSSLQPSTIADRISGNAKSTKESEV